MRRYELVPLVVAAIIGFVGLVPGAAAATQPTVAVLYFDNNTGQKKYDMLQKGFADMVITDLASVDNIQVVEREKLQTLLDELKLQRGKYFDRRTAVKIGKGLGATHTLAGSFVAVSPRMRIDVRLIDNATGKIVLTSKVMGAAKDVFELEQQLLKKFVKGLKVKFRPPLRPQTRVKDLDVLLTYSKGIDLADKENFQEASKVMALAVKRSPMFALARTRSAQILARLNQARSRREVQLTEASVELATNIERALRKKLSTLSAEDAKRYLAYRWVRGFAIQRTLRKHLSKARYPSVPLPGHKRKVIKLIKAYYANTKLFMHEREQYMKQHGGTTSWHRMELPDDDEIRAEHSKLWQSIPSEKRVLHQLTRFMLHGRAENGSDKSFTIAPTPANLVPKFKREGFATLERNWQRAWAAFQRDPKGEYDAITALAEHADALLLYGKQEKAIGKWQEILDRFPKAKSFSRYEKHIKQQLGIVYDNHISKLDRYQKGLRTCKDMDLRVGFPTVLSRRTRLVGVVAAEQTIKEIEKACRGKGKLNNLWPYMYKSMALYYARHGNCKKFDKYMARAISEGGSVSDARGYRKNFTDCPAP